MHTARLELLPRNTDRTKQKVVVCGKSLATMCRVDIGAGIYEFKYKILLWHRTFWAKAGHAPRKSKKIAPSSYSERDFVLYFLQAIYASVGPNAYI